MNLTRHLPAERREHVEARLHSNLMAWLTTVRPDGQPDSVPVWFLVRDDETILVYSQPKKIKLRNISENPRVTRNHAKPTARLTAARVGRAANVRPCCGRSRPRSL